MVNFHSVPWGKVKTPRNVVHSSFGPNLMFTSGLEHLVWSSGIQWAHQWSSLFFSQHPLEQGFGTWHNNIRLEFRDDRIASRNSSWGIPSHGKPMMSQHHQNITLEASTILFFSFLFLSWSGPLSTSHKRNYDISFTWRSFSTLYATWNNHCQPPPPPQHKTIVAYCISNHRLAIEIG